MAQMLDFVKVVLVAQLFYAVGATMLVEAMPADSLEYVTLFEAPAEAYPMQEIGSSVESGASNQLTLPFVDSTTLLFNSGNILINLVFNFIFAVPQLLTLILTAFMIFFAVNPMVATYIKLFFLCFVSILYIVGAISFLMNVRSAGAVIA